MSDVCLPESLDGANVHNARTRQDNWQTITTYNNMTPAHRDLFDKIDSIQATIVFIRITGGPFTGKIYLANGRSPSAVLQVAGPLRDELRELAAMPFWQTAVAPWIRPVHLTIVVPRVTVPGGVDHGQYAPSTAFVSYSFPGVARRGISK
jgi:hypothetical protein